MTPFNETVLPAIEPRGRVEVRLVRKLPAEEVRPLADHEDPDHRGDERDEDDDPDAETPADLLFGHRHTPFGAAWKTPVPQGKPMARKYSMRTGWPCSTPPRRTCR